MELRISSFGFLIHSGLHRDYKELFSIGTKRRGLYKALNNFVIRLSNLLTLPYDERSAEALNVLYRNLVNDDDIIFVIDTSDNPTLTGVVNLIKDSVKSDRPFEFIRSRVNYDRKSNVLVFDI